MEHCMTHEAHARAIAEYERRATAHGKELDDMRECIVRLTALQENYSKWQEEAEERITALENAPGDRWNSAVNAAIVAVMGGAVGYILGQIGVVS